MCETARQKERERESERDMGDLEGMDGQTDGWVDGCTYANGKNGERGREGRPGPRS